MMKSLALWKYGVAIALPLLYILGIKTAIPHTLNYETIRNVYFHVPMWFSMMIFFTIGLGASIKYLLTFRPAYDRLAYASSSVGMLFGILGISTGMVWATAAWRSPWNNDPKQIGAAIALLCYLAYLILRRSVAQPDLRARVAAIYNIFAYFILFPTLWILPRMTESLHPGGISDKAAVAFDPNNLTLYMRLIMWLLAVPTWFAIGWWIVGLHRRILSMETKIHD